MLRGIYHKAIAGTPLVEATPSLNLGFVHIKAAICGSAFANRAVIVWLHTPRCGIGGCSAATATVICGAREAEWCELCVVRTLHRRSVRGAEHARVVLMRSSLMTFALLNLLRSAPGSAAVATDNKSRTSGRRDLFPGNFIFVLYPTPPAPAADSWTSGSSKKPRDFDRLKQEIVS